MMYLGIALAAYLHQQGQIHLLQLRILRLFLEAPTAFVSSVRYDITNGTFTISGQNFNTVDRPADNDVVAQLDWSKFTWDIDSDGDGGSAAPNITFEYDVDDPNGTRDFASAIMGTNEIVATLTEAKRIEINGTDGLGFDGYDSVRAGGGAEQDVATIPNVLDQIDIEPGFFVDMAGNPGANNPPDVGITYSDAGKPVIQSIFAVQSTTPDAAGGEPALYANDEPIPQSAGSYRDGDTMFIVAQLSEEVLGGSAITATLNTGTQITLVAEQNQDYLIAEYTVGSSENASGGLEVSTLSLVAPDSTVNQILDRYANEATEEIPTNNIVEINGNIVIDNVPVQAVATVTDTDATGADTNLTPTDVINIIFSESVANYAAIESYIETDTDGIAIYGTNALAVWDDDNDALTITLGESETVDKSITLEAVQDLTGNTGDITLALEIL